MSSIVKSKHSPTFGSMLENFWSDKFLNNPFFNAKALPAVNIREIKGHYELEIAAPGFRKEDFTISTENGVLMISAENSREKHEEKENYTRREFWCNSFVRTFTLPHNVHEDHISAKYNNGVLSVELKKDEKAAVNKKAVKVS